MSRFLLNGQDLYGNAPQTGDKVSVVDTEGIVGQAGSTTNSQALFDGVAGDLCDVKTDLSDQQDEIEAILNVYGAKNLAKTKGQTSTVRGVTYTANADGSYTPSNTAASGGNSWYDIWNAGYTIPAGSYYIGDASGAGFVDGHRNSIRLSDNTYVTPNTVVTLTDSLQIVEWSLGVSDGTTAEQRDFKPVIIDSRILDRSFTTPVMTNRELTAKSLTLEAGTNISITRQACYTFSGIGLAVIANISATGDVSVGSTVLSIPSGYVFDSSQDILAVYQDSSVARLYCADNQRTMVLRGNNGLTSGKFIHINGVAKIKKS